jgi:hypothetical protein
LHGKKNIGTHPIYVNQRETIEELITWI